MKPGRHIIASISSGLILGILAKSFPAGVFCVIAGIVLDADHILEFIIHYGWKNFTIKRVYEACEQTHEGSGEYRFKRLYLFLHIGEFAVVLWGVALATKHLYVLAVAVGYSLHLLMDSLGNRLYPSAYFMSWRMLKGFETEKLLKSKMTAE